MVRRFDYEDKEIANDISLGMPVAGDIPTCPVLTEREKAETAPRGNWAKTIPNRNKRAIGRVDGFTNAELGAACWGKSSREINAGWLSQPVDLTDQIAQSANSTPRFSIREPHGDGNSEIRIIDDLKASGVNAITTLHDTSIPDCCDILLAPAAYYRLLSPGCDIRAASTDFFHAYKNIGVPVRQEEFTAVLLGPPCGPLQVAHLRTHPFGSSRAPGNWARVTRLIQWILLTYFGIYLPVFADDCFCVELADADASAYTCADTVIRMRGFELDKSKTPSVEIDSLGASLSFRRGSICASLPVSKRDDIIEALGEILRPVYLSPGQAAKIRGRLGFAQSLMFCRFGRVWSQPFTNRQYSRDVRGRHPLNDELKDVIQGWISTIRSCSEKKTLARGPRPVVVYVDAAGCGHLGAAVYLDGEVFTFSSHCPEWMVAEAACIFELENTSALFGLAVFAVLAPGRCAILRGDNMAAGETLVRGSSRTAVGRMICGSFWSMAAPFSIPVWIGTVAGTLNPIEPPSRDCVAFAHPIPTPQKRCEVPSVLFSILKPRKSLYEAQLHTPIPATGFCKP